MGLKPKAPKAPDPVETAKAEAAANRINEYTPGGARTTYGYTNDKGKFVAGPAPDDLKNAQTAVKVTESRPEKNIRLAVQPAAVSAARNIADGIKNIGGSPTAPQSADFGAAPDVPMTGDLPARASFDVSGAPAAPTQAMLWSGLAPGARFRAKGLQGFDAPNGAGMLDGVADRASASGLFDGVPGRAVYDRETLAQTDAPDPSAVKQGIPGRAEFDRGALSQTDAPSGFAYNDDIASALFNRNTSLMDKQVDRQRDALLTNLQARGMPVGSEGFDRAYGDFTDDINENYSRMAMDATLAAGQEDSRRFNQLGQARDRKFNELSNLYGMDASSRGQAFNENVTEYGLGADARDRTFGELSQLYGIDADARARGVSEGQIGYNLQADERARGVAENQQQFQQQSQARDQRFSELAQLYGIEADTRSQGFQENLAGVNVAERARDRGFREASDLYGFQNDERRVAQSDQDRDYGYASADRNRQMSEGLDDYNLQRNQRDAAFNEMAAVLGGQYSPTANASRTPNTAPINVGGIVNQAYQGQLQGYNAKMQTGLGAASGLASLGGSLLLASSASLKEKLGAPQPLDVLDRVLRMDLHLWRYSDNSGFKDDMLHVGPWAEDFHKDFGVSAPEGVFPTDPGFIALSAIQGLHAMVVNLSRKLAMATGDPMMGQVH